MTIATLFDRDGLAELASAKGAEVISLETPGGTAGRVRAVRRLIADKRPDVVHTTLYKANIAGRIALRRSEIPLVSSLVGTPYGPDHRAAPGLNPAKVLGVQGIDALTCRFVTRFHATAHHVAQTMSRRLLIPIENIDVIGRGRDEVLLGRRSEQRREAARALLGITDGHPGSADRGPVILCVARHEHPKGVDLAIEALPGVIASAPGALLVVAGAQGSTTKVLHRSVECLGLEDHVHLLGPRDDVADLLCAADVFVSPSRREGFPGAVIEAMAMEVPVVATDLAGVREVLGYGNGVVVAPQNPDALARGILAVLGDPCTASRRVTRARARYEHHLTTDVIAQQMVDFYRRSIAQAAGENP